MRSITLLLWDKIAGETRNSPSKTVKTDKSRFESYGRALCTGPNSRLMPHHSSRW